MKKIDNPEIGRAGEVSQTLPSTSLEPSRNKGKGRGAPKARKEVRVLVGDDAVTLSDKQRKAVREIDRLAGGQGVEPKVSLAKERQLVADLVGTAEERAVMAGLADTVAQAKVRGEAVEQGRAGGPVVVRSRDSLTELFTRKSITGEQYLGGCAYRDLYEACHRGPPSQLRDRIGAGGRAADAWASRLAELERDRAAVEQIVGVAARAAQVDDALALTVLRLVAGEGAPLNPPGLGGRPKTRRIEALRVALTAAAVALKVTGAVRRPVQAETFATQGNACAFAAGRDTPDEAA